MYLVDTNIWLERLLEQEQSEAVGTFLDDADPADLIVSDFSLHSVGIILCRLGRAQDFLKFVADVFVEGGVAQVQLAVADMDRLVSVMQSFGLDFDDAYQYVAAEKMGATIVSLDADFDRSDRGRVRPEEVVPQD
jgi:predicted nucleic acid-binding protein